MNGVVSTVSGKITFLKLVNEASIHREAYLGELVIQSSWLIKEQETPDQRSWSLKALFCIECLIDNQLN